MPCNTIQIASIELGAVRADVLAAAVASLGLTGDVLTVGASGRLAVEAGGLYVSSMTFKAGALQVIGVRPGQVDTVTAAVKRAYTRTLVTQQAKRYGWRVKAAAGGKLQLIKG